MGQERGEPVMRLIVKIAVLLFTLACLTSCSANWHLKKAIKKDPTLVQKDTATVVDTVKFVSERVQVDSVFKLSRDTVVINNDRLTIRHHYNHITDSVYIDGECAEDTTFVVREVQVPYEKIVQKTDSIPYWIMIAQIVALLIFILIYSKRK